jgi:sugar phosphate isomerase/epimerase
MRVLVSTGSLGWLPLPSRFALIHAAQADGVELMLTPRLLRRPAAMFRELETRFSLPIVVVHAALRLWPRGNVLADDLIASARFSTMLPNVKVVVLHPPDDLRSGLAQRWYQALDHARFILDGHGIQLAAENLPVTPENQPLARERFMRLVEEWDLGYTLDTAHAGSAQWDLIQTAELFLPRLAHIHLSDLRPGQSGSILLDSLIYHHQLPGKGRLPLHTLLQTLRSRGYQGTLSLELSPLAFGFPRRAHIVAALVQAIAFCRSGIAPSVTSPPSTQQSQRCDPQPGQSETR